MLIPGEFFSFIIMCLLPLSLIILFLLSLFWLVLIQQHSKYNILNIFQNIFSILFFQSLGQFVADVVFIINKLKKNNLTNLKICLFIWWFSLKLISVVFFWDIYLNVRNVHVQMLQKSITLMILNKDVLFYSWSLIVFKLMPMCMANHKLWGYLLPCIHAYRNSPYMCTQGYINLCKTYKIIYIPTHAYLCAYTSPHHWAHSSNTSLVPMNFSIYHCYDWGFSSTLSSLI